MDEIRNDDTLGKLPTLGRTVPEEREPEGPAWTWTDEDAERKTMKRPVSPEEMTLAGRYKVFRRLGEGGMGSVWLAEDLKLDGRKVAIKMLPAVLAGKKGAYRQVKQEALMAMKLSHPNIATVRAFEEEDGNPFLVMDYIEGQGLDDILAEKGKLSEEETLRLLTPVAAALDYAHAQGVVHRDVKPGNVIVRKDGTPFVLDFGIAREIQETMTRVTGKFSSGTLLYMSPEQLRGRAPKAAQDVYSFAAVAYECLSGMPPFARGQVEYQIVNEPPEPLPEGAGSSALREGIMAGLAKDPEGRPRSSAEVLGLGEAAKRAREVREAEEARRRRQEEARLAQERARAEYEKRREEQALEAERLARKLAEAKAEKAREEAKKQAMEAFQAQEARGRVSRWTGFLVFVLVVAGVAGTVWWQGEKERLEKNARNTRAELERQQSQWERQRTELERQRAETARQLEEAKKKAQQPAQPAARSESMRAAEVPKPNTMVPAPAPASRTGSSELEATAPQVKSVAALGMGAYAGETKSIRLPGNATMEMVWCPPGDFMMGSPENEEGRRNDESQHLETISRGFWMAKTEVTQEQWRSVMGDNPSFFHGDTRPVEQVDWYQCQEFCKKTGLLLPTDTQWEYACRAGGTGPFSADGWYGEGENGQTHPVAQKRPNAWGFHDMHGNVDERCLNSDEGMLRDIAKYVRGGSWVSDADGCRSAARALRLDSVECKYSGFRPIVYPKQ